MVNLEMKPQSVCGLTGQPGETEGRRRLWNE